MIRRLKDYSKIEDKRITPRNVNKIGRIQINRDELKNINLEKREKLNRGENT